MTRTADFTQKPVGAVLLRIVSRAQALLAELLRLSDRVPPVFHPNTDSRFAPVIFGFRYLKSPELFEERIEASADLLALDDEFRETYQNFLERIFFLFDGIVKYYSDVMRYLEDLQEGVYIESTVESVLVDEEGRQLLVEAVTLHGVLILLLEHRLSGPLREQLVIGYYRSRGSTDIPNFDAICTLCRSSPSPSVSAMASVASFAQLLQGAPPPVPSNMLMISRPEELLANFLFPKHVIQTMIGQLLSDDLYHQVRHYPNPEHRSTALSSQASSLYILLFYAPQMLHNDQLAMRGIVDKFFRECWVIPIFMGFTVDLSQAWDRFKAAKAALSPFIAISAASELVQRHTSKVTVLLSELGAFLSEGVLTQDFVLSNMSSLLSCLRNCNVTLRWLLLHRTTGSRKLRDAVAGNPAAQESALDTLLSLLLDTARLEFEVKRIYGDLLEGKQGRWEQCRAHAVDCIEELSEFFSGSKILSKRVADENLQRWFQQMSIQVNVLDYPEAISAGRKIQQIIAALEEVEQFHQIEASLQTRQYLSETRAQLHEMVRTLNVQESTLATVSVVSDAAYAWGLIDTFTERIHERIRAEPFTVLKLQCLFLKLRSIMDIPLLRISQCNSLDLLSVSEYYSSELVAYVRAVLEIIPVSMFAILNDVIAVQTKRLRDLPARLEKVHLRDYAQLEERFTLAKATHQVAVFTQGLLAMKLTFMGAIELDPRQLLEDGIRKQLVGQLAFALQSILVFTTGTGEELEEKLQELFVTLRSQRRSMEYFQDYVHVHGLQLWQEEFTRIINFNVEQECNVFLKRKVKDWESALQSTTVPISSYMGTDRGLSRSPTFMGQLVKKLLNLTHPTRSMYLAPMSGWFNADGHELVGLHTFTLLQTSLGPTGMAGIDRLLSFNAANSLQHVLNVLSEQVDDELVGKLRNLEGSLSPPSAIPDAGVLVYNELVAKLSNHQVWSSWVEKLAQIGQIQMLRTLIASHLRAASKVDAGLVSLGLEGLNAAVLDAITNTSKFVQNDIHQTPLSGEGKTKLLVELRKQLQMCGLHSPHCAIYITSPPPEYLSLILFLVTLSRLPRYLLDSHLGTLTSKTKKNALDCCPLVVGFGTLLQQFHPSHIISYVQYLGQYIQTHIEHSSMGTNSDKKALELPSEVPTAAAWLLSLFKYVNIPQNMLDLCLPAPILDGIETK
ncbi:WASH complex subunit strumpellin [Marchantia polymorpha subsp. ruderalis]|uniref:WASH complex subunit strumpellin n=2 Tax=Marchantia polymorpha TaxID=3197 RepID=A0AAF6AQY0_MARPO|nr:hypothetical protein MARPO_0001s0012 [Marchantia polymorpha]BBM98850.1 hypothetical protein Mp_1g16710 [Marchantia polymorpha subsp. ruderalis]|eukprot:PTQ49926.1 hypothetical protein MARPO_0001s0012 [Marchantia polymorpha]